jgi:glycosyltransferase involved in cell wall biosynthesis
MNDSNSPYISVIITAYNRKEFLLNAIKSAVNQTLDKKIYEIIIIKNFEDKAIDEFIAQYNIKNINMEGTIGEFIAAGVSLSAGEIISFLDDDDLFSKDKLEIVYKKFKSNYNLVYYHNNHITINEKYQELEINIGKSIAFNMSSISVRKFILNLDHIKKINFAQDHFMYLSALESNQTIVIGKENLTYYMFHNSISNIYTEDINEFITYKSANMEQSIKPFIIFSKMFISRKAKNYIKQKIANQEIVDYFFGKTKKPENVLDIFKKGDRPFSSSLKIYAAYLLVRVHYNFRHIIIKKLFPRTKKS